MKLSAMLLVLAMIAGSVVGQDDGFKRERSEKTGPAKDALEGKAPPMLRVGKWLNSKGRISLSKLKGKVVVLDFWGVW